MLTNLELWRNGIGDEGAKALAPALRVNGVLTTLDISENDIGPEGAKAIGEALAVNGVLTTLNLRGNNIGDEGAAALASALRVNGVLKTLNLESNNIGGGTGWIKASEVEGESKEVGAKVIYQGREMVVSVGVDSDGDLQLVHVVQTGVLAIAKALEVNEVLTTLNISKNFISVEGAKALASALRVNGVLKTLNLMYNEIGDEGAAAIAGALRGNGVLKALYIVDDLGVEGAKAIRDAVSEREGFELEM